MTIPSTNLKLLTIPIALDQRNQLTFENVEDQFNFFNSLPNDGLKEDFTYQRWDNVIRYPGKIDNLLKYNYVMYQNEEYTDKWFYAFIVGMEYSSDDMTLIQIQTDVWETWQFDLKYNDCFVEREHVNDDAIGLHTFPENLETGEYINNGVYIDPHMNNIYEDGYYILGTSVDITDLTLDKFPYDFGDVYGGIYSGVSYYFFSLSSVYQSNILKNTLNAIAENGQSDSITGLFIVPGFLINNKNNFKIQKTSEAESYNLSISKNYGFEGYSPKNNKLKTYPYCYLLGNNGGGDGTIYRYEDFDSSNCQFKVYGVICVGGSIKAFPLNYKGLSENTNEGLTLGKFPVCNYSVDMFTNWLTQNSLNVGGNIVTSDEVNYLGNTASNTGNIINSALSLNLGGMIEGTTNQAIDTYNALLSVKQHSLIPANIKGDINCGDVLFSSNNLTFKFFQMSIKREYAELIDGYFTMYGYKVNKIKTPNVTGRKYWNYVKTIGANIEGDIPQGDLQQIKNIFNNGITFWHDTDNFLNYNNNNVIELR